MSLFNRPMTLPTRRPPLHPITKSIAEVERKLQQVKTANLLKVTLGFFPSYVNLHKRVYDQQEKEMEATLAAVRASRDDQDEDLRKVHPFSITSLPGVEWSDISESSTGSVWTDSDTDYSTSSDTASSSVDMKYSSTGSDDADTQAWQWTSEYSNWRNNASAATIGWMEELSRAVFGS